MAHKLAAGGVSGFIAQTVTYPLHIVRRRMQVRGPAAYPSVSAGLAHIYRTEGVWGGLFKGVGLTWVKGPLAAAIGFTANDVLKATVPAGREAAPAMGRRRPRRRRRRRTSRRNRRQPWNRSSREGSPARSRRRSSPRPIA